MRGWWLVARGWSTNRLGIFYQPPATSHAFSTQEFTGIRNDPPNGGGCHSGGRSHVDLRTGLAHAALEIAGAGRDAHLVVGEHAHVPAAAGAAGRRRDH